MYLQLAEDRPFTLFLHSTSGMKIGYVPDAVFYFEVESKARALFAQRRR
jgi:cellulose synthase/poly-beta-1,6-N-acetylglucosamine synthase-like glycosyltransferase